MRNFLLLLVCLVPVVALGQDAASLPSDPGAVVTFLRDSFGKGEYALAVGALVTVLVRVGTATKSLQEKLPPDVRKWIAMALALLAAFGTALLAGAGWFTALVNGVLAGLTAIGGWEAFGKKIAPVAPTGGES